MPKLLEAIRISLLVLFISGTISAFGSGPRHAGKIPEDFFLSIQHLGCRGNCPTYTITLDAKGNATYHGKRAVEMIGEYNKVLPKKAVKTLVKAIHDAHFWDLGEQYGGGVADLPGIVTEVVMDGRRKKVEDIRMAPHALKELEAKLETIIGREGWVRKQG